MVNIISIASELGYLNIPDNTLIDIDQLKNYPDEKTVLITTGSQGESTGCAVPYGKRAFISKVTIKPNDTDCIQFQSDSREMRKQFPRVINELYHARAQRLFSRIPMYPDMPVRKRSS